MDMPWYAFYSAKTYADYISEHCGVESASDAALILSIELWEDVLAGRSTLTTIEIV